MAITEKSLRIFSAVEALRAGHADVRQALLPLFQPDMGKFNGQIFDPKALADEINLQYRLNITADIVTEMIPLFEAEGWLTRLPTEHALAFRVTCEPSDPALADADEFMTRAAELGRAFRAFITELSPLAAIVLGLLFVVLVEGLPIVLASDTGIYVSVGLFLMAMLAHFSGELKKRVLSPIGRWLAFRTLENRLQAAGLTLEDLPYEISYSGGQFSPISGQILPAE
jgi:hypothetical protein